MRERPPGFASPPVESFAEAVQQGVKVVVFDDEGLPVRILTVGAVEPVDDLKPQRSLAAAFLAEDNGCRRVIRAPGDLVPGRMMCSVQTELTEHVIRHCIFLSERVLIDSVMFEELLDLHGSQCRRAGIVKRVVAGPPSLELELPAAVPEIPRRCSLALTQRPGKVNPDSQQGRGRDYFQYTLVT